MAMSLFSRSKILGRYRELVIAITVFLIIDLGALVLNFYTASQIASDAVGINLAGRQRMLSQRMTKALLQVETSTLRGLSTEDAMKELALAVKLFDSTLGGFLNGATVIGGDGKPIFLRAVTSVVGKEVLQKSLPVWEPYLEKLTTVLSGTYTASQFDDAVVYAKQNNLKLLGLMNELTTALEAEATNRAGFLRLVQTIAITLAVLNFIYILVDFIGRLRKSDAQLEVARQETVEIMDTVSEGLFLLDQDAKIGQQHSKSLVSLLGEAQLAGKRLIELFVHRVPDKVLQNAEDYIKMLFQSHVNEKLVRSLNPLDDLEIYIEKPEGGYVTRHLEFQFKRVFDKQGHIIHILTTASDISDRVRLKKELEESQKRAEDQMDMLLKLLHLNPTDLQTFLARSQQSFAQINGILRQPPHPQTGYQKHLRDIFTEAHSIKGESGMLGLDFFMGEIHDFEEKLREVQTLPKATGNEILSLTVRLNQLIERVESIQNLINRVGHLGAVFGINKATQEAEEKGISQDLRRFLRQLAEKQQKSAQLLFSGEEHLNQLTDNQCQVLKDILIQFVRNALVHGIEAPALRQERGKARIGEIAVEVKLQGDGLTVNFRDDGEGLVAEKIRAAAIRVGKYTEAQLAQFSEKQVIGLIFEAGFSTANQADHDAGRGVGMDVVRQRIQELGGKMRLTNQPGLFCEWSLFIPYSTAESIANAS